MSTTSKRGPRAAVAAAGTLAFIAIVGYLGFIGVSQGGASDEERRSGRVDVETEIRNFNPPSGSKGTIPPAEAGSYVPLSSFLEYIAVAGPAEMSDANGIVGYVRTRDVNPLFWTKQPRPPAPVYAADLVTIVGTFGETFIPQGR